MRTIRLFMSVLLVGFLAITLQNCTIIRPGEVGVVTKFGKMKQHTWAPGAHYLPLVGTKVFRFSTRITDYSENMALPTKEGLAVKSDVTLLYHILPDSVKSIYVKFGYGYQAFVIKNFAASAREIFAMYLVKDIITAREEIEGEIMVRVNEKTSSYGIHVDQMLLRDIQLPDGYEQAIKSKVNSEQLAMQTKFEIDKKRMEVEFEVEQQTLLANWAIEKEKKEAERLRIEGNAIKKYQDTISSSLTDMYIRYKNIEVTKELVGSNNTKVIVTDGKSPVFLNSDK